MSYILEALRKAEQERSLGRIPDLKSLHAAPLPAPRRRWIWLGVGFILMLNAMAWVLIVPLEWKWVNLVGVKIDAKQSMVGKTVAPEPPSPMVHLGKELAEPTQPRVSSQAASAEPSPRVDPPAKAPESPIAARPPVSAAVEKPLAFAELSTEFRRTLPELNLDVHVYSAVPARNFVMINARRYGNGERLAEGPWLETIVKNGVVLRHGGQRFLLPVQR